MSSPADAQELALTEQDVLRRRIVTLMGGRLAAATLLLGGTLLFAARKHNGFGAATPMSLMGLIIATFAASALFAIWVQSRGSLRWIAAAQIAWDLLLTTGLVYLSGGAASVFSILYGITILSSALVASAESVQAVTIVSLLLYTTTSVLVASGWVPHPPDQAARQYLLSNEELGFSLLSNIAGMLLVAILARNLATRLQLTGGQLRRMEESAAELARLHDDIVRSIASGLITTDLQGTIWTINPAGAAAFGASPDSLQNRPIEELLPIERTPPVNAPDRGEVDGRRRDGTRFPVGYTRNPLVNAKGTTTGTLISFQDLTELRELRDAAERSKRLATLGRLAAGLAHEIRNPLGSISGSVELVREGTLGAEDRRLLGIVQGEVERLEELVTTMLQIGRPTEPALMEIDLRKLVRDVVAVARGGLSTEVRIGVEADDAPLMVRADPGQMRQVLWNLLKNAVQASVGSAAALPVAASSASSPSSPAVYVITEQDPEGPWVVLEVRDEGEGIDETQREQLFDVFYSGRRHGIGLGLSLVKQIVDAHGGRIEARSLARGASFRVMLPALAVAPITGAEKAL